MPKVERVGCMQMILHKLPYPDAACNTSDITVLTFACIQLPCLQVFGCNKLGRFVSLTVGQYKYINLIATHIAVCRRVGVFCCYRKLKVKKGHKFERSLKKY